jgi:hypothetical protein
MKIFAFACSLPVAAAFWLGAQTLPTDSPGWQEPDKKAEKSARRTVILKQDQKPRTATVHGRTFTLTTSDDGPQTVIAAPVPQVPGVPAVAGVTGIPAASPFSVNTVFAGPQVDSKSHKAFEKLRNAESKADKAEALDELREALESEYDEFLSSQEKELDKMEEKMKELRSQLEKRRDAKDDLIELRLKTLENDASGLGWPGGQGRSFFWHTAPGAPHAAGVFTGPGHLEHEIHAAVAPPGGPVPGLLPPEWMSGNKRIEMRHLPGGKVIVSSDGDVEVVEADVDLEVADAVEADDEPDAAEEAVPAEPKERSSENRRRRSRDNDE